MSKEDKDLLLMLMEKATSLKMKKLLGAIRSKPSVPDWDIYGDNYCCGWTGFWEGFGDSDSTFYVLHHPLLMDDRTEFFVTMNPLDWSAPVKYSYNDIELAVSESLKVVLNPDYCPVGFTRKTGLDFFR